MAGKACVWMTCQVASGGPFVSDFYGGPGAARPGPVQGEVSMCPTHAQLARRFRRDGYDLRISQEGWVYPGVWMDGLGFLV